MVRSPSGVTMMKDLAVAGPDIAGTVSKSTPKARIFWAKSSPSVSFRTLPMKAARPPSEATPAAVLAAQPPEMISAGPIA